jgi:hypothetical protein
MGIWDGAAPKIKVSNQAKAFGGGPQLDFSSAYNQGIGGDQEYRKRQMGFVDALQQQAAGKGPGADLANAQLQQGLNQGNAATASQVASARGLNPAQAIRMAAQQGAAMNQGAAAQGAAMRAQQQLAAQGQLGAALGNFRGQDQNLASMGMQGNQAQNALNAQNYNTALGYNVGIGTDQAKMDQAAQQAQMQAIFGSINGVGGAAAKIFGLAHGGNVVDSESNDSIPAMLSPGEAVLTKTVRQDPEQSKDFIASLNDMSGIGEGKAKVGSEGFLKALLAHEKEMSRRVSFLEQALRGGNR